jgi:hypothetical protein
MNTTHIVNHKGKSHFGENRTQTHWITLGPHRIAKIPREDKYILPGGKEVTLDIIEELAERNGWVIETR